MNSKFAFLTGFTAILLMNASPMFAQSTRIMPLGNSITSGVGSTGNVLSYRKDLWNMLSASFSVDFVGTLQDGDGTFDEDHDGHPGWKASEVRQNVASWLQQARPDFVLLHIGTNDVSAHRATSAIIADIDAILTEIWTFNADARVFLCSIVPRTDDLNNATLALNQDIQNLVAAHAGSFRIHFVDQYSAFVNIPGWQTSLMADEIHPNNTGYQLMAETFYTAILPYLSPVTPVELVAFRAQVTGTRVQLSWTTASETNNLGFAVEHRFGSGDFEEIDFVGGNGTTTVPQEYTFTHVVRQPGLHEYRLRQVDTDGRFAYSRVLQVTVSPPSTIALLPAYPNPFRPIGGNRARIRLELPETMPVRVTVYDIRGRQVTRLAEGTRRAGLHEMSWDGRTANGQRLPNGQYFIRLEARGFHTVQRIQLIR
ncbi:MAG: GDSL-type esterase/lipase family protein [candidate division KSB1 bacterium]|nr:GDSL-type esterase/lipase family protein [candidate division KSB1 bacterium]